MIEFGKNLREAREAKGYTVGQLAEKTHIMHQIVEEMEIERFTRIPAPIYGRGFVKLYCEAVGLDPKPFIAAYMELQSGKRASAAPAKPQARAIQAPPKQAVAEPQATPPPPAAEPPPPVAARQPPELQPPPQCRRIHNRQSRCLLWRHSLCGPEACMRRQGRRRLLRPTDSLNRRGACRNWIPEFCA